jgi:hypothetical protein
MTRATSAAMTTSRAWVTSACNAGTSALPRDRSCRNKTQEGMRMHERRHRRAGSFSSLFRATRIRRRMFELTEVSVSCSNLSVVVTCEHTDSALSPTCLQSIGGGGKLGEHGRCSPNTLGPAVPKTRGLGPHHPWQHSRNIDAGAALHQIP